MRNNKLISEAWLLSWNQGCGAGTGRNCINLGTLAPELYSEYSSGSEYKEMKQTTQKI
jgi:hypothetical protein